MTELLQARGRYHVDWEMEQKGGKTRAGHVTVFGVSTQLTVVTKLRENHVDMEVGIGLVYDGGGWTTETRLLQWTNTWQGEPGMRPNGFGRHHNSESYWVGRCFTTRDCRKAIQDLFLDNRLLLLCIEGLYAEQQRTQAKAEAQLHACNLLMEVI